MKTPLERTEDFYQELVKHYEDGDQREMRAATKLLMVALDKMKQHGGLQWSSLLDDYVVIAKYDNEKFRALIEAQRSHDRNHGHGQLQG